jgi:hypothetical protein
MYGVPFASRKRMELTRCRGSTFIERVFRPNIYAFHELLDRAVIPFFRLSNEILNNSILHPSTPSQKIEGLIVDNAVLDPVRNPMDARRPG